jgi:Ca2+-binding RTX toxin-like protein
MHVHFIEEEVPMPAPPVSGSLIQLSGAIAGNQGEIDIAGLPNGRFLAVYRDSVSLDLLYKIIKADGTVAYSGSIVASVNSDFSNAYSIGVMADGTSVIAYQETGGVITFRTLSMNGLLSNPVTVAAVDGTKPKVLINTAADTFSIAFTNAATTDINGVAYNADLTIAVSLIQYNFPNATTDNFAGGDVFDDGVQAVAYYTGSNTLKMSYASNNYSVLLRDFTVATNYGSYSDTQPLLTKLADGNMLVVWNATGDTAQGRVYNRAGAAVTAAFDIGNGIPFGVTALKNGGFMVTMWDTSGFDDVLGRFFDASYQPVDATFTLMNGASPTSVERRPEVTELADGRIVVSATINNGASGLDAVAQIYDPRIGGLDTSASSFADDWRGTGFADKVYFGAGNDLMAAGGGNDTIYGEGGADMIYGEGGNDDLLGGGGIDDLLGGANNDNLYGELGNDNLYGESGEDYLSGGAGDDYLSGGTERDNFIGGAGRDTLIGGQGDDQFFIYTLDDVNDVIVEYVGEGNDRVFAAVNYSLAADSEVETISTTSNAGTTAVTLNGSSKNNTIIGNNGVNSLNGMGGNDILYGLGGVDYFWFTTAPNGATNADTIIGFSTVDDFIFLDDAIYTGIAAGALNGAAFLSGAGAINSTLAAHRIIHNTTTGDLFWDPDGVGGANATRFATIGAGTAIAAGDIYLV